MGRLLSFAAVAAFAVPGILAAEPATQAGADALAQVFQSYVGKTPGAVTVRPEGETYAVTLDPALSVASISVPEFSFKMTPLDLVLTDQGNGTWGFSLNQPVTFSYSLKVDSPAEGEVTYGSFQMDGVFDTALGAVVSAHYEAKDVVATSVEVDPVLGAATSTQHSALAVSDISAKPGVQGVDMTVKAKVSDITAEIEMPPDGLGPVSLFVKVDETSADASITGYQTDEVMQLWAWFVAHPGAQGIAGDAKGLKAQIEKALPLFADLDVDYALKGVGIDSPVGQISMETISIGAQMTGVVPEGRLSETLSVTGLVLPDGLVPEFAKGLVPTDATIGFTFTDFDLSGAAYVLLSALDQPFGSPPPAGFEEALKASLLPKGTFTMALPPGFVATPDYKLTYEGTMVIDPDRADPVFDARIGLTGYEAVRGMLATAPPEMGMGAAAMGLGAFAGLAKPGAAGELVWEISLDEAGTVLVNGVDPEKLFSP